jgi:RpiB/LacA/LacB family sugar-phosphate isomerase
MAEKIVVSSDHAGWGLKQHVKPFLESLGYGVEDVGTYSDQPVDYPAFTVKAALKVVSGECRRGIVFCGTGQGDAVVANKVPGIRAALCWDIYTARLSRAHNDANMLVLGGWVIGHRLAEEIIRAWLETSFDGGRHERRLAQLAWIEQEMLTRRRRTFDISRTIEPGMVMWPGEPDVVIAGRQFEGIAQLTTITMSTHTGSHVDAPAHVIPGDDGIDGLDLGKMVGLARVCHLGEQARIERATLERLNLDGVARLLLGTQNSELLGKAGFSRDYAHLTTDAAQYLVEKELLLVGVDYLSVEEPETTNYPVHHALLYEGVVVLEGINLSGVPEGDYELLCLPLKIKGGDGAPARVILREL